MWTWIFSYLYRSSRKTFIPFCSVGRQETTPFWVVATLTTIIIILFYVDLEITFRIMQLQLTSTKPIPVNQIWCCRQLQLRWWVICLNKCKFWLPEVVFICYWWLDQMYWVKGRHVFGLFLTFVLFLDNRIQFLNNLELFKTWAEIFFWLQLNLNPQHSVCKWTLNHLTKLA